MHVTKNDIPVKIDAPGAIARQQTDFGAAFGVMGAEFFTMAKGADLAPLLVKGSTATCVSRPTGAM